MASNTPQRQAIRRVLETAARPLSPGEVRDAAARRAPRLGIATVYRAIKELVAERWLTPVVLPGEPARYEREGKAHHHHFRCRRCRRVFEIDGCDYAARSRLPRGFRVERHEVILHGLCDRCG